MRVPSKYLLTMLFNKIMKNEFDWIDGIFFDKFAIVPERNSWNPLTNRPIFSDKVKMQLKVYTNLDFEDELHEVSDIVNIIGDKEFNKFMSLLTNPSVYSYVGLKLDKESFQGVNIDVDFLPKKNIMTPIEEKITNLTKRK
jgi:hypothetical protein